MRKYSFRTVGLASGMALMLIFGWAQTEAFAGTLTETLKKLFNEDIGNFAKSMKLDTFELMAIRSITVKGDAAKFRALNWMNDEATGGIKGMGFEGDIGKGDHFSFEGHAIPGDNDLGASLKLTRGNGGYITMDYGNFRKWYDVYGGYYSNFAAISISQLRVDPKIDIGHFNLEIGSSPENERGLSLSYERDTKDGIKTSLAWGSVIQSITRKINPAWAEVGQTTDAITLKGRTDVGGFKVNGQQRAEFFYGRTFREENNSTSFQSHEVQPQAKRLASSLKADRWVMNDKTYLSFGYQYQHLKNDMLQAMKVYNTTGTIISSGNNLTSDAQSSRDSNAWVEHFFTNLTSDLNLAVKLKQEIIAQTGTSYSAPGLGATAYTIESENYVTKTGESMSLRYGGIPKTSLYTDWDFQQTRTWDWKYRTSPIRYEALIRGSDITGATGMRYVPNSKLNMTSQIKLRSKQDTYNRLSQGDSGVSNDEGFTIGRLRTNSNEWDNRVTYKPFRWFQNSFRLQLIDNIYHLQSLVQAGYTNNNDQWIKSQSNARVYTYDAVFQPWDQWMFDVGGSLNQFKVSTPASQVAVDSGGIPVFVADVYTLLFSASYAPKENFSIYSSAQYSRANDFDAQNFLGIPYGVNNESYDITLGMKWSPKKDLTLEPHYGYYSYRANPNDNYSMDYGNYSAHLFGLDTKFIW